MTGNDFKHTVCIKHFYPIFVTPSKLKTHELGLLSLHIPAHNLLYSKSLHHAISVPKPSSYSLSRRGILGISIANFCHGTGSVISIAEATHSKLAPLVFRSSRVLHIPFSWHSFSRCCSAEKWWRCGRYLLLHAEPQTSYWSSRVPPTWEYCSSFMRVHFGIYVGRAYWSLANGKPRFGLLKKGSLRVTVCGTHILAKEAQGISWMLWSVCTPPRIMPSRSTFILRFFKLP